LVLNQDGATCSH